MRLFTTETRYVVSNTGDRGYVPDPDERLDQEVPNGFPAKLVKLLHARWRAGGDPVTFLPCELTSRNGDVLRDAVLKIAQEWETEAEFQQWIGQECVWANSLVDRIVSEPLQPIGAVAEPYALWAIEDRPSLTSFCRHRDIRIVPDLRPYEWLKLFILNLGHTFLAERWLTQSRPRGETVREALQDPDTLAALTALYEREVLPIFAGIGMGDEAAAYKNTVMDRFANPYLNHRLSDIASNHAEKKIRRIGGLLDLARARKVDHPTPVLDACLNSSS
jgi:tagaturonate reductase